MWRWRVYFALWVWFINSWGILESKIFNNYFFWLHDLSGGFDPFNWFSVWDTDRLQLLAQSIDFFVGCVFLFFAWQLNDLLEIKRQVFSIDVFENSFRQFGVQTQVLNFIFDLLKKLGRQIWSAFEKIRKLLKLLIRNFNYAFLVLALCLDDLVGCKLLVAESSLFSHAFKHIKLRECYVRSCLQDLLLHWRRVEESSLLPGLLNSPRFFLLLDLLALLVILSYYIL